jgi:pyrimidine-nucleoside phosphorylase
MTLDLYRRQLREIGVVMIGATDEIAPADRKLYALRDVTATVAFVPFIAASIMSKKLAEGIDALVLDVKAGRGAFMADTDTARDLAEALVRVGDHFGTTSVALLTDMNEPLGCTVGNWPEVEEAIRCLKGDPVPEITELSIELGAEMLLLAGAAGSRDEAQRRLRALLASGEALETFCRLVDAQGGNVDLILNPDRRGNATATVDVHASDDQSGFVTSIDALTIGRAAARLGAGRRQVDDDVYPLAGITLLRKRGDRVQPGDNLARLHTSSFDLADPLVTTVREAFATGSTPPAARPIVIDRLADGVWNSSRE